ncbi:MAG: nucleotide exchange factor GrpE [Bacillota bacterium]
MSEEAFEAQGCAPADDGTTKQEVAPDSTHETRAADQSTGEAAEGAESAEDKVDLEALLRQETALKERYLAGWQRAQADLENLKKRVAREQAEFRMVVVEALVKDMLPALDSLERAVKHAKTSAADEGIAQGLDLVMNKFLEFLEREGIRPISAAGEPYDPMRHEAILQVPTSKVEEGTVLEEVQRGYASKDRVIRPALVTVACRPAPQPEEAATDAANDADGAGGAGGPGEEMEAGGAGSDRE